MKATGVPEEERARRLSGTTGLRIVGLFLAWRLGLLLVAWLATAWFPPAGVVKVGGTSTLVTVVRDSWLYWDGDWYESIARLGYTGHLAAHNAPIIFNFFPLFPLLGSAAGALLGGDAGLGLLFVSNLCALGSCLVLYRLARLDSDAAGAERAVLLMLAYPFAFFLGAGYSESLFLLLTLLSFLAAREGRWAWCGAAAGLACLTRHVGIVLLPVLLVEYLVQEKRIRPSVMYLLLIPCGMLAYFLYLQVAFGDFLLFFSAQQHSLPVRHMTWQIWKPFTDQAGILLGNALGTKFLMAWAEVFSVALAVGAGALAMRRLRPSYGLYCLLAVLPPLTSGLTLGLTRYVVVLFPIFLLLAGRGEETAAQRGWLMLSVMLLSFFTVLFTRTLFVG